MSVSDTSSPFLPLPDDISILSVRPTPTEFIVSIASNKSSALCPCCGTRSERVHGHYARTVADLPCGGRRVILALTVRTCVCAHASCPQRIFTERLVALVQSYARMTNRLREALVALGLAPSAQVSERLAPSLGMRVWASTLLRRLREVACPSPASVRILGVDDWSWKKGQTDGTLLVDLELRKPIELLADRREETLTTWLLLHPEIDVMSRDRGGEYAAAARKGAPQAPQLADKFPILKNLRAGLKEFMARKQKVLPEVEEVTADSIPLRALGKSCENALAPSPEPEQQKNHWRKSAKEPRHFPAKVASQSLAQERSQISRTNRLSGYEAVRALHEQLISEREIARRLKMSRQTVQKFLSSDSFPERSRSPYRGSILDPVLALSSRPQDRLAVGTAPSYTRKSENWATPAQKDCFGWSCASVRKQHQTAGTPSSLDLSAEGKVSGPANPPPKLPIKRRLSPARASWLYVSQPHKLDEKQQKQVEQIRAAHDDLDRADTLTQEFVCMLAEHRDTDLDSWLARARHSGIKELKSFANGIQRDDAAVRAAFIAQWSNGPVEAQGNCLKLQKRLMFGRANFDLLRLHVLRRA